MGTGRCEFWITSVDLVRPKPSNTTDPHPRAEATNSPSTPSIPLLALLEINSLQVAYIYSTDGKCQGMLTPKRIDILHNAFHRAKQSGIHDTIQAQPKTFAFELLGLFGSLELSTMLFRPNSQASRHAILSMTTM
eukprot:1089523-Pelagomonas_calceolata.AAC.1